MGEQSVYDDLEPKIHKKIAEAVADAVPVLDVACGDGRLTGFIASGSGCKTYGIDISVSHLTEAREKAEARGVSHLVYLAAGDARKLCFLDGSFGSLIMLYSLHEIQYLPQALEEARRVLRPNGKFIVVDPVKGGKAETLWNESYYGLEEIESMLTHAGFSKLTSDFLYDDIVFVSAKKVPI
ncbi:MAG: class I SAM-dependent methyltransferase [Deltaproteobacteria bacterium]|nr:class I SAM-dependent methyltransferase [Deltaproteobacteria bacterium]MBW2595403.1 class I SAM-dependent methyltransferase [Deltaproteobacteria bacterium]MBW2648433.1 class I SAM-dependent methyltransferase [Deltaproteobacteria bacterium]